MTLVAAGGFHTFPAIFGDVPVVGAERPQWGTERPLVRDGPGAPDHSSETPNQRVVLLGDNCVIAWAGNVAIAQAIVAELRALASKGPLSVAGITGHLSQLDAAVKENVSFVGWLKEAGVFHQFWHRADIAKSAMFGQISAAGTGATGFVTLAARVSATTWNVIGGAPEGLERAVSWMLSGTSLLYQAELASQDGESRHLGGGYEIATFAGDRFAKLGDISYVFWTADLLEGRVTLKGPELVLKHDYAGESLLLQVLRMRRGEGDADPASIGRTRHLIPAFGIVPDPGELTGLSWPAMAATLTCHVIFVRTKGDVSVMNRVEYSESRSPDSIRFIEGGDGVDMQVSKPFCDELTASIESTSVAS